MNIFDAVFLPFIDYAFMHRALVSCLIISVSSAPLGIFLVLRRMTLLGEVTSHAILPGVAIAFLISGLSLWPMTIGSLIAGIMVAIFGGIITRITSIKEDASFTAAYLTSLAFGVMIISIKGSSVDLLHILFGNVLAVNKDSLFLVAGVATITLISMAIIYRPLIVECFDSSFLRSMGKSGAIYHQIFLLLIVLNLVASFQVLGTLMAVGLIILPPIATRFWTNNIDIAILLSILFGSLSAMVGLLLSYHFSLPSGSAIVLSASVIYLLSVFFGHNGGVLTRFYPRKHFHLEN